MQRPRVRTPGAVRASSGETSTPAYRGHVRVRLGRFVLGVPRICILPGRQYAPASPRLLGASNNVPPSGRCCVPPPRNGALPGLGGGNRSLPKLPLRPCVRGGCLCGLRAGVLLLDGRVRPLPFSGGARPSGGFDSAPVRLCPRGVRVLPEHIRAQAAHNAKRAHAAVPWAQRQPYCCEESPFMDVGRRPNVGCSFFADGGGRLRPAPAGGRVCCIFRPSVSRGRGGARVQPRQHPFSVAAGRGWLKLWRGGGGRGVRDGPRPGAARSRACSGAAAVFAPYPLFACHLHRNFARGLRCVGEHCGGRHCMRTPKAYSCEHVHGHAGRRDGDCCHLWRRSKHDPASRRGARPNFCAAGWPHGRAFRLSGRQPARCRPQHRVRGGPARRGAPCSVRAVCSFGGGPSRADHLRAVWRGKVERAAKGAALWCLPLRPPP